MMAKEHILVSETPCSRSKIDELIMSPGYG
jgi:hypothetical protein